MSDDRAYTAQLMSNRTGLPIKQTAEVLAIDPGGVHVGVALFRETKAALPWECWWVKEFTPDEFVAWLETSLPRFDVVVVELFRLYEDMAQTLIGSEMETSQLIGVIKYLLKSAPAALMMQPAAWQQPVLGILRARDMRSKAKAEGAGSHCLSAELHGWAYLIRTGLVPGLRVTFPEV